MPETQQLQYWFEEQLAEWVAEGGPITENEKYWMAEALTSAWPSSPQGQAVKALVETLEWFVALADIWIRDYGFASQAQLDEAQAILARSKESLATARKAGLE